MHSSTNNGSDQSDSLPGNHDWEMQLSAEFDLDGNIRYTWNGFKCIIIDKIDKVFIDFKKLSLTFVYKFSKIKPDSIPIQGLQEGLAKRPIQVRYRPLLFTLLQKYFGINK